MLGYDEQQMHNMLLNKDIIIIIIYVYKVRMTTIQKVFRICNN